MNLLLHENHNIYNNSLNNLHTINFKMTLKKNNVDNYNELALFYKEKKLNKKVIYFYKKVVKIRVSEFGLLNIKTINAFKKLAEAYLAAGMIIESLNFYGKSLDLSQDLFGKESLEAASNYSALANIHFSEENLEEAFSFYLQALKIRENHLGENHPLTASSQHELGYFYAASEEYTLALPLFEKALETRVELYRLSHPQTAKSYNSLAMCHYHLFNYDAAYRNLLEAIRIKELILPKSDEYLQACKKNLVEIEKYVSKEMKRTFLQRVFAWIKSF